MGFCVNYGSDQNNGVIKLYSTKAGPAEDLQEECLDACIQFGEHHLITGCEAIWHQQNRGCYAHTEKVTNGNGANKHSCWVIESDPDALYDTPEPEDTPMQQGYCVKANDSDQNSGVIKLSDQDAGPSQEKFSSSLICVPMLHLTMLQRRDVKQYGGNGI